MASLPHSYSVKRSRRLQLAKVTPAVLRLADGRRSQGLLQTISMTGGMLSLRTPLLRGARVRLMFLTDAGAISGAAEMLKPVSWSMQPFRFTGLDDDSRRRLSHVIEPTPPSGENADVWIAKYRSAVASAHQPRSGLFRAIVAALMVVGISVAAALYLHVGRLR